MTSYVCLGKIVPFIFADMYVFRGLICHITGSKEGESHNFEGDMYVFSGCGFPLGINKIKLRMLFFYTKEQN